MSQPLSAGIAFETVQNVARMSDDEAQARLDNYLSDLLEPAQL